MVMFVKRGEMLEPRAITASRLCDDGLAVCAWGVARTPKDWRLREISRDACPFGRACGLFKRTVTRVASVLEKMSHITLCPNASRVR